MPILERINSLEAGFTPFSDHAIADKTQEFKKRLDAGETLDDVLPEAFAVCREMSQRKLNMRHFDVQLVGGMILHKGRIMVNGTLAELKLDVRQFRDGGRRPVRGEKPLALEKRVAR